jgi:hypothetical protein
MKAIIALVALLALFPAVHANVVISQVLYDPINTESGGEAVELRNDGNAAMNISGWTLQTETSLADATIPSGTMLQPGATFLIADAGWNSSKDDTLWKAADREETITMANSDSGVALKDAAGALIDAVGWGTAADIKAGLFEGTPATGVAAGKALVRAKDTNNNLADFIEGEPSFFSGDVVVIIVNVTNTTTNPPPFLPLGAALLEDDSPDAGTQLRPAAGVARTLRLEAHYNGTRVSATGFGKSVQLTKGSGDAWTGELSLDYWTAPGAQNVVFSTEAGNTTLSATVLELKAIKLQTKTVAFAASPGGNGKGVVSVVNQGNVAVRVSWSGTDLSFNKKIIPFENLNIGDVTVQPKETKAIEVSLTVPTTASPGEYRTMLAMET